MAEETESDGPLGLGDLVVAVDHVGIATADLEATIARYAILGFRVTHRETNDEQQVSEVMLAAGGPGGAQLQLLAPTTESSTIASFLERRGPGLQQLALRVRDVDRASHVLRTRGVRLLYDSPRRGTGGARINFVHPKDAGGVLIELTQPPDAQTVGDTRPPDAAGDEGDSS